jgi:hypothetical protein
MLRTIYTYNPKLSIMKNVPNPRATEEAAPRRSSTGNDLDSAFIWWMK